MQVGAMIHVSESLYEATFEIIERANIEELSEIFDQLHIIVDETNDLVLLNLIDSHLFEWTNFIIAECRHGGLSSHIQDKAVTLIAQIMARGLQMCFDSEINKFSISFIKVGLDKVMLDLMKELQSNDINKLMKNDEVKIVKRIKLQAAIAYCLKVIAPQMMDRILHEQQEIKIITSELSCSFGEVNDSDEIISINIRCIQEILDNLGSLQKDQQAVQLLDEVNEDLESEGIAEETDLLIFHSDIRQDVGVYQCAQGLKKKLRKLKNPRQRIIKDGLVVEDNEHVQLELYAAEVGGLMLLNLELHRLYIQSARKCPECILQPPALLFVIWHLQLKRLSFMLQLDF
ncbi:MAG: hypothetical protein EZS28_000830 [Streblomastix strix]|uniref:Uncharacterized protein n=1 Tax=Streblomastix strix TaxID=222440 RepID=A0A5J4X936_9EUKA|nr:MAG: hypothetical protein EZS28_000830 [Streblomastix strix]